MQTNRKGVKKDMFNIEYTNRNCCFCHDCVKACPSGAISVTDERLLTWDKNKCSKCETCCDVCVNEALYGVWKK